MIRVVVLISGRGSNLQALIDAQHDRPYRIVGVIANRPGAPGLAHARAADIPARVVDHQAYADRDRFEQALAATIDEFAPELVALAGFMRILGPHFVARYAGRLINIHPSLLPAYRGLDTHRRVLEAGDSEHGASVHFVTAELDGGPVLARTRVPVHANDTPERLAERVLTREHRLYPAVVELIGAGRIEWRDGQPYLDSRPMEQPLELDA